MKYRKPLNTCPKADRCIHASDCINHDVFRGEYLCFESIAYNNYITPDERRKQNCELIKKGKRR